MEEEINGIKIYRYYSYASPKVNLYNRLLNYLSFMLSSLFFIFKKEKLKSKGIDDRKIKYISNGFDKSFLKNEIKMNIVDEFNLKDKFTLVYAGNIGLAQGLDIILNAAENLKDYSEIQFLIIGDGLEKDELEQQAKKAGLNNLKFLGLYPHASIYTFLKYSDASIIPLKNENLKDSVPSKLFESLGAGCPVILSASGESEKIVNDSNGGLIIEPGNSDNLKDAILKLYNNKDLKEEYSKNGQEFVLDNFTKEKIAKKLEIILIDYLDSN
ncbi:Glycosyl transferases group 1 [Halanaerobium congolense]|uniref:Glycosyl transferases group 1 n=1 Tax=Halanaerobium congolense TaxID=54121 RepID=A0A1G8R2I7_9FIRM|nr:glycosyltransferase family 4 protein [Halanaerobium congolense]SDJ11168.1 Glycosyl transferases group 1 [Halanaerobium congolense]SET65958.1 Glycosyl transferases group 1 [Halanaerobium congolense]